MKSSGKFGLFNYLDYRAFLKDAFQKLKSLQPNLTYRLFAKMAGYSTPNILQQVVNGRRHLSQAALKGTCSAFGFSKLESEYFQILVAFQKSKRFDEKDIAYRKIISIRNQASVRPLEKGQNQYFSQWFHPVVRELVAHPQFDGSPEWMARRIFPRVSIAQVSSSLSLLEKLGFIRKKGNKYVQADTVISTDSETASMDAYHFQKKMLEQASQALNIFQPEERDFRMITLGTDQKGYELLKEKMQSVWLEILALAADSNVVNSVYQINFQLFPLTKYKCKNGGE